MRLIDDTPSEVAELPEFIEHRHDQSIFSLLVKQSNQHAIIPDETEWFGDWIGMGDKYPIWATRHRSIFDFKRNETIPYRAFIRRYAILSGAVYREVRKRLRNF